MDREDFRTEFRAHGGTPDECWVIVELSWARHSGGRVCGGWSMLVRHRRYGSEMHYRARVERDGTLLVEAIWHPRDGQVFRWREGEWLDEPFGLLDFVGDEPLEYITTWEPFIARNGLTFEPF